MKKKIIMLLLATSLTMSMTACGGSSKDQGSETKTEDTNTDAAAPEESEPAESEKDIPEGTFSDTGNGTMYISTPGGTSENGNVPVMYEEADVSMDQIGLDTAGFDGSKLSFIYIDGMLNSREQLADSQTTLTLEGDALKEGTHKVEVLQYENDEPSTSPVTYKSAEYEIKAE